jgi:ribose 5-phosphate isomerase B
MSIAANRKKGIRCALCISEKMATLARQHNDANVVAVGGRTMAKVPAQKVVAKFLTTDFSGEPRHARRNSQIDE